MIMKMQKIQDNGRKMDLKSKGLVDKFMSQVIAGDITP